MIAAPALGANFNVATEAELQTAIANAVNGDTITFTADIALTANLPAVTTSITLVGNNRTLSGPGGAFSVASGTVAIQALAITATVTSNAGTGIFVVSSANTTIPISGGSTIAVINNTGGTGVNAGGVGAVATVNFETGTATTGATIANTGGQGIASGVGGAASINFIGSATAANATIDNFGGSGVGATGGSSAVNFNNNSTAGAATINNRGAPDSAGGIGFTVFNGGSTAGSATITAFGSAAAGGGGGFTSFLASSSAGTATLIANGGAGGGSGGSIRFGGDSSGGTAIVQVFGNANLDISTHNASGVSVGSFEGSGAVFLGSNTLTSGGTNSSTTFSGVLQDGGLGGGAGGSLTKIGTGTLTLSGANTFTGATTVSAGTLGAGAAGTFSAGSAHTVAGGAVLDLSGFDQTIGSLAGAGSVMLVGAALTAGANNTSTTFSGMISGAGTLTKAGTGTLTFTGANSYTGGTTVAAGTLAGTTTSLQGNIVNNAAVSFDQAGNGTYAGAMSGTGTLAKAGAGNLNLSGASTYSGATTINAGTLSVNGSIASPVTVASGGILGGTGIINGAVGVASGGVFAPGNSIGTITVNGSVTYAPGSIYRVEIDAAGAADRINVTGAPGTATLNGGTVDVQASAGTYQQNTRYTIINATGGVAGAFAGVTSNLAFLTPALAYDASNVFLDMARNTTAFGAVALTRNQRAVAGALDNSATGASPAMSTLLAGVTGLSAPQARNAFDSLSGVGLVALRRAAAGFAGEFGQHLNRRLGLVASNESATRHASLGAPILIAATDRPSDIGMMQAGTLQAQAPAARAASSASAPGDGRGFWLRFQGASQDTGGDGNAAGSKLRGSGLTFGADTEIRDGMVLGIAASSGRANLAMDASMGSGRTRGAALGAYASYVNGPWLFKGAAGMSWNDNHMDRPVNVGATSASASADFDSRSTSLYAEASYEMNMRSYTLRPIAALLLTHTASDAFTERGAGVSNLQVAGQSTRSTRTLLGLKTRHELAGLTLEPRLLWSHEFGNLNAPMTMTISGSPDAAGSFQIYDVDLKRDSAIMGLAVSGSIAKNVNLVADLQFETASRQDKPAAFVGLRATW